MMSRMYGITGKTLLKNDNPCVESQKVIGTPPEFSGGVFVFIYNADRENRR